MIERGADPAPMPGDVERLERDVRVLRERLAFYEGFDLLIQDNVAHARELLRLAAQEREETSAQIDRGRQGVEERQAQLRADLEDISLELGEIAKAVGGLSDRIARALSEHCSGGQQPATIRQNDARSVVVVAHGVPSAQSARSLQQFVATLPQVATVSAREFAGGVLRLDARVNEPLLAGQFQSWERSRSMRLLTERPDVIEIAFDT